LLGGVEIEWSVKEQFFGRKKLPSSLIVRLPKSATSLLPQYRKRFAIRGLPLGRREII
jgi:hypothetical protein